MVTYSVQLGPLAIGLAFQALGLRHPGRSHQDVRGVMLEPTPCRCSAPMPDDDDCMRCGRALPPPEVVEARVARARLAARRDAEQRVVVLAIQAFHARHGRPPRQLEWTRCDGTYPSAHQVARVFGTWKAGIVAAGFDPPAQGRPPKAAAAA
jgi:hypothetical protein